MTSPTDSAGGDQTRLSAAFDRHRLGELDPLQCTPGIFHPALERICAASGGVLKLERAGHSFENRPILSVTAGSGPTRVLLWSQMHGDESTATRALADIFACLAATPGEPGTRAILTNLTILALPMLNPDGAARLTRRSAQGIDLNRDALACRTPEARLLTHAAASFRPAVSFNLHDQELSTTGDTRAITALALLAPAFDAKRSDSASRTLAKKVASFIAAGAAQMAPGRIARYDDGFEPRAFGDVFQKNGYGTVLVESGHAKGDPEKMSIRRMNFVLLLSVLERIAAGKTGELTTSAYDALPANGKKAYDVIVRNVTVRAGEGRSYRADLGISRQVDTHSEEPPRLVDAGDLSTFTGMEEIDGSDAVVPSAGLVFNLPFDYSRLTGA
jgi:hypothetical protein